MLRIMNKLLLLLILSFSFVNASIIKNVEVFTTKDDTLKIEDIKKKDFKRIKLPFIRDGKNNYFLKLTLDKTKLNDKNYVLELNNEFDVIRLEKKIPFYNVNQNIVIDINSKSFYEELYFKVGNEDRYVNFNAKVFVKDEFVSKQIILSRFYGISNGIVLAAFLYYLALFFFNREKSYIYYALTQASMLIILVYGTAPETENDGIIMDFVFLSFIFFSNLFTRYFLNTKKYTPRLNKFLNLFIILYLMDMFLRQVFHVHFFEENIPLSFFMISYLVAAYLVYKKGYKPALFYLIGWSFIIFAFFIIEIQYYIIDDRMLFDPVHLMYVVSPLESLILAFALSYKMKIAEEEKTQQQEFLAHQSKLASMGEMIGNIAHQWRQPLTHLSYVLMNLKTAFDKDRLTAEYFDKKSKEANSQLEFMSHTINDFKDFFKMSKQKEKFNVKQSIDEVINLLSASLKANKIEVDFAYEEDITLDTYRGEFLQVLFNLINNAKDEYSRQNILDAKIFINLHKKENKTLIEVLDKAGGIESEVISKVFEPYFTTKEKGLGIGLYMSKMIIERNMNGKLEVQNYENGALFKIIL